MRFNIFCRSMCLTIALMLGLFSAVHAQWRLDGDDRLRNFRIDEQLNASASAQPSIAGFRTLKEKLPRGFLIYIVDLRQESHGFANDVPISWYSERNAACAGLDTVEIERDEVARLQAIEGGRIKFMPIGKSDTQLLKPLTLNVKSVKTEREVVENVGFHYVRFTDTDMTNPDAALVDEFVRFVEQLPPNAWLHFHCHAGMGRGTLFLVLYDIIRHPEKPLEEIVARQKELGGLDLFAENNGDDWAAQRHRERAEMVREFYRARQNISYGG